MFFLQHYVEKILVLMGTADQLDKNRFRIFQPTLGFLSAKGGTYFFNYEHYERGYPQVLNGLVLKGLIW